MAVVAAMELQLQRYQMSALNNHIVLLLHLLLLLAQHYAVRCD
jgi:hypothetical protein